MEGEDEFYEEMEDIGEVLAAFHGGQHGLTGPVTRARISYLVNDTVHELIVEGPRISTQLWDSGRAVIMVRESNYGWVTRLIQLARVILIDTDRPNPHSSTDRATAS